MKVLVTKDYLESKLRKTREIYTLLEKLEPNEKTKLRAHLARKIDVINTQVTNKDYLYDFDMPV
jgi:hypothetical protein